MDSMPKDRLLRVPEAAELLGIKESTLRKWIFKRKITSIRVGKTVSVRLWDCLALMHSTPAERAAAVAEELRAVSGPLGNAMLDEMDDAELKNYLGA